MATPGFVARLVGCSRHLRRPLLVSDHPLVLLRARKAGAGGRAAAAVREVSEGGHLMVCSQVQKSWTIAVAKVSGS